MKRFDGRTRNFGLRSFRALLLGAAPVVVATALAPPALAQAQTYEFSIESQPLSAALLAFGRQADLSVLAASSLLDGKTGVAVRGQMSAAAALERLLEGSGLTYVFVQSNAVKIIAKQRADNSVDRTTPVAADAEGREDADRVIVTGTNIRGVAPPSAPVEIYSKDDIARTGAVTTEQFVGKLPQNVGSLTGYAVGASTSSQNVEAATGIDLRGLGIGTTLTLMNGRRMALSSGGRTADVSFIPLGAIERVEVLTDGASAIYGSDAIGGVVNFILRKDFEGAETSLSYSGVAEGGLRQGDVSQTAGTAWDGGSGLVSYSYHSASPLKTSDRSYAAGAGPGNLTPLDTRHSAFATISQDITDRLTLDADIGGSWRKVKNRNSNLNSANPLNHTRFRSEGKTEMAWGDVALDYKFDDTTSANLSASYSELDIDTAGLLTVFNRVPPRLSPSDLSTSHAQLDVMGKLDGSFLELPSGEVRYSIGGGLLDERFDGSSPLTLAQTANELGRRTIYAFGEVFAPLAVPSQNIPFASRLSVSLAARYTKYEDKSDPPLGREFGDSIDPKIGVQWSPIEPLGIRATYGTSFRAPSVSQLDMGGASHNILSAVIAGSPGYALTLEGYAVGDLGPETSEAYTFGIDYEDAASDLRFGATFYSIDYEDRIGVAPQGGLDPFATPSLLPDLIYRAPTAAFIEQALRASPVQVNLSDVDVTDPVAGAQGLFALPNFWIYDGRFRNLAISRQSGIDYSIAKSFSLPWADLQLGLSATNVLSYEQQASDTAPIQKSVDRPGLPPDWRLRGFGSATMGDFSGTLSVNYVDDYSNPRAPVGLQNVDSWTTVDIALAYRLEGKRGPGGQGTSFSLSIQNLLDEDPPLLRRGAGSSIVLPVGFDTANANPLGRFISVGVSHTW